MTASEEATQPTIRPPGTTGNLNSRISAAARSRGSFERRIQRAVANAIVGQMIPGGVVKGGTAMKLRRGEEATRFTPDLDASRPIELTVDQYIEEFALRLADGWNGFTGTIEAMTKPQPPDVPDDYIMTPFEIALAYRGRHWLTVEFELGRDEVGSTLVAEPRMAGDIVALFRELGLPDPAPVPVMDVAHQIAQKLHACTSINAKSGENERAHDLVDLQLLVQEAEFDLARTVTVARRLFASRQKQSWPPRVRKFSKWPEIYEKERQGLPVLLDLDSAIDWANSLIASLEQSAG